MAKKRVGNIDKLFSLLLSEFGDLIKLESTRDRISKEFIDACEEHGVTFHIDESKFPSDSKINSKQATKKAVKEMANEDSLAKQAVNPEEVFTNAHTQNMKQKGASFKEGLKNVK